MDAVDDFAVAAGSRTFEYLDRAVARTAELTLGRQRTGTSHDDADDDTGTICTDGAIDFDPRPLLRELQRVDTPVVVIGQVAGILHGSQELTGDLDLLWDGDPRHAPALAEAFAAIAAELVDNDGKPQPCEPESFLLPKVRFKAPNVSGDCCTPALPWGTLPVADFIERCLRIRADDGRVINYLRREDLITMREAVGRPKDRRRTEELRRLDAVVLRGHQLPPPAAHHRH